MKYSVLIALLLTGCSTLLPVQSKFPKVPDEINKPCEELNLLERDTKKLSEVLQVVTTNYGKYYDCSYKVEAWQEWYEKQKQIHDSVNSD
jgi:hypothetical protein